MGKYANHEEFGVNAPINYREDTTGESFLNGMAAIAPPGMKMALGENPKGVSGSRGKMPSTRMGNIAMMREWFLKGKEYGEKWKLYEKKKQKDKEAKPPDRDLRLEALRDIVDGKYLVHVHSYNKDEMLKMMELADEFGFRIRSSAVPLSKKFPRSMMYTMPET